MPSKTSKSAADSPENSARSMATMSDIARRAGVSRPTVSVVLNERHDVIGIADATRQKVLRVAAEMGYRRNELARAVKTGRSRTLGFLAGTANMEYAARCFLGAMDAAEDAGFSMQRFRISDDAGNQISSEKTDRDSEIGDSENDSTENGDSAPIVRCVEHRLAGAIVYDPDLRLPFDTMRREFDAHELPAVLLDRKTPHDWGISVASDDENGARLAVEYLADLGHRKIVWLGGIEGVGTAIPRLRGYRSTMKKRDLAAFERAVWTQWKPEKVTGALAAFMAESAPPTAIICGSDVMALMALKTLRAMGKDVPREVSVVGFGDLLRTDLADPALTTIAVPYEEMGREAARLLIEIGARPDREVATRAGHGSQVLIPTRLIIRHSTAPPLKSAARV